MYQRFHVRFWLPAMHRGEFSAATTQLMSKCLWSEWKWWKGNKEIAPPLHLVSGESWIFVKEKPNRKKKTKKSTEYWCMGMKSVLNLSSWRSLLYRNQFIDLNHWTGFYTTRTSVMKELMFCYLHVFIEIYSLIMTK